jgi:hypothetical protein
LRGLYVPESALQAIAIRKDPAWSLNMACGNCVLEPILAHDEATKEQHQNRRQRQASFQIPEGK